MSISFECPKCGKHITAPDEAAGRRGACPACGEKCEIPATNDESDIYDLAPLDDAEEMRRAAKNAADLAIQQELLREQKAPEDAGASGGARGSAAGVAPAGADALLKQYLETLADGKLDRAERLVQRLAEQREAALALIDRVGADDVFAADFTGLPRPVLLGFLRQLRSRL